MFEAIRKSGWEATKAAQAVKRASDKCGSPNAVPNALTVAAVEAQGLGSLKEIEGWFQARPGGRGAAEGGVEHCGD